ncbi:MAG: tol-pal system protein YbgF [Deltaproteobacteria bacterium]|jgi:tol-pal system protein YbgF|nr:tol-pal system protein YbgF [Deltaproteobacteria bacterium]
MDKKIFLCVLALTLFVLPACGGTVVGGGNVRRELDALKMEVADLRDRSRQGNSQGGGDSLRVEVGQLRTAVQRVTENVETASLGGHTLRQQLEYMSARLDRLEKKAGLPALSRDVVAPLPPAVPVVAPYPTAPQGSGQPPSSNAGGLPLGTEEGWPTPPAADPTVGPDGQPTAAPAPTAGPDGPPTAAPPAYRSAYDEGKELFDQKNYQAAVERFKAYLAAEPAGSQAAGAQFYVGESLYFQNQFEEAILEYQTLVVGFPKNALVSTALLKQGLSFQALGDAASAKLLYQKVVKEYPKSYSAGIARERLKTI